LADEIESSSSNSENRLSADDNQDDNLDFPSDDIQMEEEDH